MTNQQNIFSLYNPHPIYENMEKDFLYRQTICFLKIKELTDMFSNLVLNHPSSHDFFLRDVLATGLYPDEKPSFLYYANKTFQEERSIDTISNYTRLQEFCISKKHNFLNKILRSFPETTSQRESVEQVKMAKNEYQTYWNYVWLALSLAFITAFKMKYSRRLYFYTVLVAGYGGATLFTRYKNINEVFDSFGELKDKEWEKERYKIMNFCYLLTPKFLAEAILKSNEKINKKNVKEA